MNILLATQRVAACQRDRERNFSKRSSKVNKVVGNPAGLEFDCSNPVKGKCGPEFS